MFSASWYGAKQLRSWQVNITGNSTVPRKTDHQPIAELAVRMPADIKAWLEAKSRETMASQNSEVVRALRAAMAEDERRAG